MTDGDGCFGITTLTHVRVYARKGADTEKRVTIRHPSPAAAMTANQARIRHRASISNSRLSPVSLSTPSMTTEAPLR
jgi:hypothetical protein